MGPAPLDLTDTGTAPAAIPELLRDLRRAGRVLQALWEESLESRDFALIERLAAASQAVHRAVVELAGSDATEIGS
jgi:hypothetical protein